MTLVFVHIPKAAGTSLKNAITDKVGSDNIYFDYCRPLAKGNLHRKVDCLLSSMTARSRTEKFIFGHFLVGKYANFNGYCFKRRREVAYATFLRDPLQRAISHFFFWKRTAVNGHQIWERFTQEKWSLEQFLLFKEYTNFQAKFLWRFPLSQFDFIGLTEHFDDSVKMLGDVFPLLENLPTKVENNNPKNAVGINYRIDSHLAAEFRCRNQLDYALYDQAVEIFMVQKYRLLKAGASR